MAWSRNPRKGRPEGADTKRDAAAIRWRLSLGEAAESSTGGLTATAQRTDAALQWLYGRDPGGGRAGGPRGAGAGGSALSVPDWINEVHELFPKETIERLERDAVETYGIVEIVTDPKVLERVKPSEALLQAVLQTKHLMNAELLASARALVRRVVAQLMDELATEVRSRFHGLLARNRSRRCPKGGAIDLRRTLLRNLAHYDPQRRKLYPQQTFFFERRRRKLDRWQVILLVDQSGSMLDSTIHAAITAAILHGLPGIQSHLLVFDTEVVDLTQDVTDPVETLMKVQLGGGTFIAKAVRYAAELIQHPHRAIVVVISDFYEGDSPGLLEEHVRSLHTQGTLVLGLAALNRAGNPEYDRQLAERLVEAGAEVGAMTPGQLAGWLAEKIRR